MIHVLIVLTYVGGHTVGVPSVSMQEFTNKERCDVAVYEISRNAEQWRVRNNVHAFCVPR